MLGVIFDFVCVNALLIINLSALQIILCLTFSATNKSKNIGVLVSCYYAVYISLDLLEFGLMKDGTMLTFGKFSLFYLACFMLTLIVFVASLTLFMSGNNSAGLYAIWLLVCLTFDGASSIFQLAETNVLLIMYNIIQNISVLVDLFVVFIGMDHVIKRNHDGAKVFINYIDCKLEYWRGMVFLLFSEGEKCSKKK